MIATLGTRACYQVAARLFMHPAFLLRATNHPITVPFARQISTISDTSEINGRAHETAGGDAAGTTTTSRSKGRRRHRRDKLTPEKRVERFDQLLKFIVPRLGYRPAVKTPQVRQSAWTHLFGLATTSGQLENVAELFPRWRDSRRVFDAHHAELFVLRCEQLGCPELALKIFGDHSKYGFALSLPAARNLLYSLHAERPLADTLAAAALFRAHGLPAPSEDLVSCAMLVSACLKHEHENENGRSAAAEAGDVKGRRAKVGEAALQVAEALVPSLRELLSEAGPVFQVPDDAGDRTRVQERPRLWLIRTLEVIEQTLAAKGSQRAWRITNGHVHSTAGA